MTLPYSFELFPPRTPNGFDRIDRTVEMFAKLDPAFVSVTFGAGGSDSRHSLGVLQRLLDAGVPPMAHLTCVGLDVEQASRLVRSFLDAGITRFLALRGDLPHDAGDRVTDLRSAAELVQLIDRVDTEREPYQSLLLPGLRRSEIRDRQSKTEISVAAFPNGHPGAGVHRSDVAALLAKQSAGATMAITQLFFDPFDYLEFVDLARAKGVTIPIVPGIVIPTFLRRLERSAELSGERLPTELARRLDGASDDDARRIGVDTAVALIDELRDHDIPGIHLYTFNDHRPAFDVLDHIGLTSVGASPA
ncbi:methylenetetrahydrofolate reductase [Agrococcus casei]|uniref:methylenetetrahydrofolate reductase n=1 Tax=Agrococcus casei TaxID=343512 RepID=UPI003F9158A4